MIGYRSSQQKWIHYFGDVHGLIFVVDLCPYDQPDYFDLRNPMRWSLEWFHSLCRSRELLKATIFLYFNKKDIFMEKITRSSLR